MKHQQKSLKDIKILLLIMVISFSFYSCKNKSYGELYFFEQKNMNTTISLSCEDIYNLNGLRKIKITNKDFRDLILKSKKYTNQSYNVEPDVRYKIIIKSDTFCFDYVGNFVLNSSKIGRIKYMDKIEKYVSRNKSHSTKVTEPTFKPWKKDK